MSDQFSRSRMLLGDGPQERLFHASVALFGVGGVGGFCAEALARAGIGALDLYDDDTVSESNLNRQLIALHSTLGRPKAEVMAERVRDINPACRVRALRMFYLPENAGEVDLSRYDYVVDAVDTVSAKLELAVRCQALGVPSPPSWSWPSAARPWGSRSSAPWARATSWTPPPSPSPTCPKRRAAPWPGWVPGGAPRPPGPPGGGAPPRRGHPPRLLPPPGRPGLGLLCPRRRRAGAGRGGHPGSGRSLTASKKLPPV